MKTDHPSIHVARVLLCCLSVSCILAGCCINIGGWPRAKFKRTDELHTSLEPGSSVSVETSFGSIDVRGSDVTTCDVIARVCVQAPTEKEAHEIADQVKIKLLPSDKHLAITVDKPKLRNNRSVAVSFEITVPNQTSVKCKTSFGSISIAELIGEIDAKTSFAGIDCENIQGPVRLHTSYGEVNCRDINSDSIAASSSFGGIDIVCSRSAPPQLRADISTSYGSISFKTPPGFAGSVDLATSFGSIKSALPLTVQGQFGKETVSGTIGAGDGMLNLRTSFGSIEIK
jgi:hypothetical protein